MFLAELRTPNYEFATVTASPETALANLRAAWENHADESGATWTWEFMEDSVTITPFTIGDTWTTCDRCENLAHN